MSLTSPPSRPFVGALLLLSALVVLQPAGADAAEDKAKAAKKACISGDFARGVELLSDLYVETNDLNFVFNQGRCFEQSGRYQDAINRFHEYARKLKDAGKPADPKVEQHITECQAMLDRQTSPTPAMPPVQPSVQLPVTSVPVPAAAPIATEPATPASAPAESIPPSTPAENSSGRGLRIAGLATMGLGVASVTTGLILNLKANQIADDLESSDLSYSRKRDNTRSSYKMWGWVSYGVGAACVAGGAVLYLLGRSQGQSGQLAFAPVAGPGQVGAVMQGGF
jgi:hypothetical protein